MREYNFLICGIPARFEAAGELPGCEEFLPFRAADAGDETAVTCRLVWYDEQPPIAGREVYSCVGYTVYRTAKGWCYVLVQDRSRSEAILLDACPTVGRYVLYCPASLRGEMQLWGAGLSALLIPDLLLLSHRRLMVHASFVRWHGQGLLFTGPSGMGKSTQARLWETHMGAEVLNGDRAVCEIGDEVTAWGSPWAGSSGIWRNECAPLRAIVALRQADENTIRPLRGREALAEMMPRMATVPWAEEWHVRAMELAIALIGRVPVWRLSCRPDGEAAALVRQTVFGE